MLAERWERGAGLNWSGFENTLTVGDGLNQAVIFVQIICAVLAGAIIAYLAASGRRTRASYSYMVCIGLMLLWNLTEVFQLMANCHEQFCIALKIKFFPVVYIGVSWLYFCLSITHSKLIDNKAAKLIAFSIPTICYLFLVTNEWHNLFFTEITYRRRPSGGPVFWIHVFESYFCLFYGTIRLFVNLRKNTRKTFRENIWIFLAVIFPMTADFLMMTNIIPNTGIDITAQVTLLSMIFFGIAVYQKRFLNLIPVAARHFIENMSDGIIIVDNDNLVTGMNEAVNNLFPGLSLKIYDSIDKVIEYIRKNNTDDSGSVMAEAIKGKNPAKKGTLKIQGMDIALEIHTLKGFNQTSTGRMIILEDRSEEQQLMNEIRNKNVLLTKANERLIQSNKMLTSANSRLEQFSATIEELAISRERDRMGREVHDTVGHTLTLLVALAENAIVRLTKDQQDIREILEKIIELSRGALNDIRSCLKGTCMEPFKKTSLFEWMSYLVKSHATSGTTVELSIQENLPMLDAIRIMAIYRICQESITNAIRHGHAGKVSIIIKHQSNTLRLYIFDDGTGCKEIIKGYGLTGMEERITKLGGTISFGSDGEKGFNIIAELPV